MEATTQQPPPAAAPNNVQPRATPNTVSSISSPLVEGTNQRRRYMSSARKRRGAMLQSVAISALRTKKKIYLISYSGSPIQFRSSPVTTPAIISDNTRENLAAAAASAAAAAASSSVDVSTQSKLVTGQTGGAPPPSAVPTASKLFAQEVVALPPPPPPLPPPFHIGKPESLHPPPPSSFLSMKSPPIPLNNMSSSFEFIHSSRKTTPAGKSCLRTPSRPNTPHSAENTPGGGFVYKKSVRWWDGSKGPRQELIQSGHTTPSVHKMSETSQGRQRQKFENENENVLDLVPPHPQHLTTTTGMTTILQQETDNESRATQQPLPTSHFLPDEK